MQMPTISQPIVRGRLRKTTFGGADIHASQGCGGVPSGIIGACFDQNGPIPGKWNCAACCALRGAISWQGGGYAVAC